MDPSLRIAFVGRSLGKGGGAGRLAEQLAATLRDMEHSVGHFIADSQAADATASARVQILRHPRPPKYLHQFLRSMGRRLGYQARWGLDPKFADHGQPLADWPIYHFHDICDSISPRLVWRLAQRFPIVWTMHDCSAFTGGCIQPMDCQRFALGCGSCPQLGVWPIGRRDRTRQIAQANLRILAHPNIHLVAPSKWMARTITSRLPNAQVTVIYNGVDEASFFPPSSRQDARINLGLNPSLRWVLLPAIRLSDHLKGFDQVIDTLANLDADIGILTFGHSDPQLEVHVGKRPFRALGHLNNISDIRLAYQSATVTVVPSRAENCSMTILEAQACGSPVIASRAGGNPEIVQDSRLLFSIGDIGNLTDLINSCRDNCEQSPLKLGNQFRMKAVAASYLGLYRQLLLNH